MFTTGASPDSVIVCKKRKAREGMAPPRYLGSSSWWRDDSLSTVKKRVRKIKFVKRSKMYNFICCFYIVLCSLNLFIKILSSSDNWSFRICSVSTSFAMSVSVIFWRTLKDRDWTGTESDCWTCTGTIRWVALKFGFNERLS